MTVPALGIVTEFNEVSRTEVEVLIPWAVITRVSVPSVVKSVAIGIEMVAVPLELTIAVPDKAPPVMSEALTPEME